MIGVRVGGGRAGSEFEEGRTGREERFRAWVGVGGNVSLIYFGPYGCSFA